MGGKLLGDSNGDQYLIEKESLVGEYLLVESGEVIVDDTSIAVKGCRFSSKEVSVKFNGIKNPSEAIDTS